eukprot:Opistho-2@26199
MWNGMMGSPSRTGPCASSATMLCALAITAVLISNAVTSTTAAANVTYDSAKFGHQNPHRFVLSENDSLEGAFSKFVAHFGKSYAVDGEYERRRENFRRSIERHAMLNARETAAGGKATFGINFLSDLTTDEFRGRYLSSLPEAEVPAARAPRDLRPFVIPEGIPQFVDLRLSNPPVLGPIRDQQKCGGCWAISTVEVVETAYATAGHPPLALSAQQVISCDTMSSACTGGRPERALAYMQKEGLMLDEVYPFVSGEGTAPPCYYDARKVALTLDGAVWNFATGEADMLKAFLSNGTLSVAVNADTWGDYVEGIIQRHCDGTSPNHAVQIVGYDLRLDPPAWIVKNSWSSKWGLGGYLYIAMDRDMCLIGDGGGYYVRFG